MIAALSAGCLLRDRIPFGDAPGSPPTQLRKSDECGLAADVRRARASLSGWVEWFYSSRDEVNRLFFDGIAGSTQLEMAELHRQQRVANVARKDELENLFA
jgi:hypothetical protein